MLSHLFQCPVLLWAPLKSSESSDKWFWSIFPMCILCCLQNPEAYQVKCCIPSSGRRIKVNNLPQTTGWRDVEWVWGHIWWERASTKPNPAFLLTKEGIKHEVVRQPYCQLSITKSPCISCEAELPRQALS